MTPDQKAAFLDRGCIHLPGALGMRVVRPVRDHVLAELKRLSIWSGGRTLSQKLKGLPIFQQTGKLGQLITCPDLGARVITKDLLADMSQLAGAALAGQSAQLLLSLPHQTDRTLAGLNWHRDISKSQQDGIPGVQAFILLDDVAVNGGATLVLAGSHRLKNQQQAKQGIAELTARGLGGSCIVDDVELSIIEMAGKAGDVYLMDMRLLHTPSINATKNVRMMATARYLVGGSL